MRFTAPVKPLLAALAPCAKIAPASASIPILGNVLIEAGDGIAFVGNDLDKTMRAETAAVVSAAGRTTAAAHLLLDILRKLNPEADVAFEQDDKGLVIRSGRARFTLQTLNPDDFPVFDEAAFPHVFTLPASAFAAMFADVAHAISTEETRYYLNGVFLHAAPPTSLRMVATDGHRLARRDYPLPDGAAGIPGMIVPRAACVEMARLAGAYSGDARISASSNRLRAAFGPVTLTTKLVDGTFPDYMRVIPHHEMALTLDREALARAVDRVSVIASERGRAVKFSIADAAVALSTTSPDAGSANEEIESDWRAAPIEIGFNARYLLEALATLVGDRAAFDLGDPNAPAILRDPARSDLLIVLMPLRV